LFGVMGLIFGPLLLSYFNLLVKIYRTEFGKKKELRVVIDASKTENANEKTSIEPPGPKPEQ